MDHPSLLAPDAPSARLAGGNVRRLLDGYRGLRGSFDEWIGHSSVIGPNFRSVPAAFASLSLSEFDDLQSIAERSLLLHGVTFSVQYGNEGTEKIFPFCLLPRIIAATDWKRLEQGLRQRILALEAFLSDVYGKGRILAERRPIREMVLSAKLYDGRLSALPMNQIARIHVAGIDVVRDPLGRFLVLEDNLRTPSGVSYALENRRIAKQLLRAIYENAGIRSIGGFPAQLARTLIDSAPSSYSGEEPNIVVLTPGRYNSAYFEHTFLARSMGVKLVEPADLFVDGDDVFVRTTSGSRRVDVIYRRIDDAYLDPEFFRADSLLGVPGLMRAYARGSVSLANAPGNGIADDKGVYPFVPEIIRYYLGEEPLIEQVPTYVCMHENDRRYVLEHLEELVVKAVDESGGYGMLMGPEASRAEREDFRRRIQTEPRKYIAQPRLELSTCPVWDRDNRRLVPRRVDFRPYILRQRHDCWVLPGGLSRVALREGSYVVNSCQGGGSKDTWVEREAR